MKKDKEELTRIHKEKCRELKEIRSVIAADLGIELHQRECTFEGYCSGTCPACRSEERKLNAAILKKQMEGSDLKRKTATAGLAAAAALCLSGCTLGQNISESTIQSLEGDIEFSDELQGLIVPGDNETNAPESQTDISKSQEESCYELQGDYDLQEDYKLQGDYELQGEIIPEAEGEGAEAMPDACKLPSANEADTMPMEENIEKSPETEAEE